MHAHRAGHLFALSWHGEKNIKRLLQSLARASLNRSTPLAAAIALLLFPLALFADTFTWCDQTFEYEGATLTWSDLALRAAERRPALKPLFT